MESFKKWASTNCYNINAGIGILFLLLPLLFDCYKATINIFSPFFLISILVLVLINLLNETICKRKIIYLVTVLMYFILLSVILYYTCRGDFDRIHYYNRRSPILYEMIYIYIGGIIAGLLVSYWQQKQRKDSVNKIEQKDKNI